MELFTPKAITMKTVTILCIGDSHKAGFPDYDPFMGGDTESSYQFWLQQELLRIHLDVHYQLINEGRCGDTSQGIVQRLLQTLKIATYDLVILAGGTNDLGLASGEQIFKNLKYGYAACLQQNIPVIASSIPPVSLAEYVPKVIALNKRIQAYTSHNHVLLFADWFGALQDEHGFLADDYNAGDGVHLSIAGYRRIGLIMSPVVKQALTQKHPGIKNI